MQDAVDAEVKALLALKAEYKELTGEELAGGGRGGGKKEKKGDNKAAKENKPPQKQNKPPQKQNQAPQKQNQAPQKQNQEKGDDATGREVKKITRLVEDSLFLESFSSYSPP